MKKFIFAYRIIFYSIIYLYNLFHNIYSSYLNILSLNYLEFKLLPDSKNN